MLHPHSESVHYIISIEFDVNLKKPSEIENNKFDWENEWNTNLNGKY